MFSRIEIIVGIAAYSPTPHRRPQSPSCMRGHFLDKRTDITAYRRLPHKAFR